MEAGSADGCLVVGDNVVIAQHDGRVAKRARSRRKVEHPKPGVVECGNRHARRGGKLRTVHREGRGAGDRCARATILFAPWCPGPRHARCKPKGRNRFLGGLWARGS
jgi:hypothetical protein